LGINDGTNIINKGQQESMAEARQIFTDHHNLIYRKPANRGRKNKVSNA